MWFSVTLWTILASLICSTLASSSSSSSLHSVSYPDYDKTGSRGYSDSRWNNENYERESKIGDLNPWSADADTLTRQILDSKSPDAAIFSTLADQEDMDEMKKKRESHSLSIVNPLDVLRQRLMLEMARRRMKENQDQIRENAVILKNLGKRAEDRTNYLRRIHVLNSEDFDV